MITHEKINELVQSAIAEFNSMTFTHSCEQEIAKESLGITMEILALARMGLGLKLTPTNIVKHH